MQTLKCKRNEDYFSLGARERKRETETASETDSETERETERAIHNTSRPTWDTLASTETTYRTTLADSVLK